MYNAGEGVPANPMTAISWYQNAEKARARAAQQDPRLGR
jgi:TPR repeat protein